MSTALIIAIGYYVILSVGTSIYLKKKVKSGSDFVTGGGHTLAWPLITAGFVLAPLGSGHTLSLWEASAGFGASVLWWGIIGGGLFVPLFLLWFGPWFRRLHVQTFPEGMGKIFGDGIGWLISAVFPAQLIGICIAEILATATAFYALSGEAIPFKPYCVLLAVGLTILYIIVAGLQQVAWMNFVNAIMLIAGSFAAVFATGRWLNNGHGGWQSVADFYTNANLPFHLGILNFSPDVMYALLIPCLFLLVFMCSASQAQYQPLLLARSESDIRKGVFYASFINSLVTYPWVILALVGMSITGIAAAGAKLAVPKIALMALPQWMVGILMIALLAATLSTSSQLILASSHMIVHDIFKRAVNPKMSDRTFLILTRVMIFVCAFIVIIPALKLQLVLSIFFWTFSFGIPVFGVYLIGMVWKVNRFAAWVTMLAGYGANFLWTFAPPTWLPDYMSLNVYPTTFATVFFGVFLNLILPGKPGYLRQLKMAEQK
ncbi:MAG: sodium:solute symporter family protein [Desulfatiglans sp.]|jgi:SSS family solute:Na+ symporter|nr:sodium:solute symporter family protein [Desulfatiglans sp.]